MTHLNNLDPEWVGEQILETKQLHDVSACVAADIVFALVATERDAHAVAGNGSRPATQPPTEPLESV